MATYRNSYKLYTWFQANNDTAYFFSHNCQALQRRKMFLVTARDKDLGNLVCFNKYLLGAYHMQGTVESQIIPFPSPLKKRKASEERELRFWGKHYTVHGFFSYREPHLIPHWAAGLPPVSRQKKRLSWKSVPLTQLTVSCKHINQCWAGRGQYNLDGHSMLNGEPPQQECPIISNTLLPSTTNMSLRRLTPTLGTSHLSTEINDWRLWLSKNPSAESDKCYPRVCKK